MAGWLDKLWLPAIAKGLAITMGHLLRSWFGKGQVTIRYPEERHVPPPGFRGQHHLKLDAQGQIKCVACCLCQTACPALAIQITPAPAPWNEREKYPAEFTINLLRCIYCGMCEEACPVDAIELTTEYDIVGLSREEMIFDKEKLLNVYDVTIGKKPM